VSITINIELKPFEVPKRVEIVKAPVVRPRQEGITVHNLQLGTSFDLKDLDAKTLNALCDEFRANVFAAAGKEIPKTEV